MKPLRVIWVASSAWGWSASRWRGSASRGRGERFAREVERFAREGERFALEVERFALEEELLVLALANRGGSSSPSQSQAAGLSFGFIPPGEGPRF